MPSPTIKDIIPKEVFEEIIEHIEELCPNSVSGSWKRGRADEDVLTGDFWGRISKSEANSNANDSWKWEIEYKKFRGRGKGALEKPTGADGIFEVVIYNERGEIIFQKAFLFQAKMEDYSGVDVQAKKMNRIAPDGSIIIVYKEGKYVVAKSGDYLERGEFDEFDICDFLISQFLECLYGKRDMTFSIEREELSISQKDGSVRNINAKDIKEKARLRIRKNG